MSKGRSSLMFPNQNLGGGMGGLDLLGGFGSEQVSKPPVNNNILLHGACFPRIWQWNLQKDSSILVGILSVCAMAVL